MPFQPGSWRTVAVPVEHGGWGFLIEPALLGMLVAPTASGGILCLAAVAAFLARHPLKLVLADAMRRRVYPRTWQASIALAGYAMVGAGALALALALSRAAFWWPLVAALPVLLVQLAFDAAHRGRELAPELCGSVAAGALAASLALAGGWADAAAGILWGVLAVRATTSVAYVRARLRLERGRPASRGVAWSVHLAAVGGIWAVVLSGRLHWLAVVPFVALLVRALVGLSSWRRPARAQAIGLSEMAYGAATALVLAASYVAGGS